MPDITGGEAASTTPLSNIFSGKDAAPVASPAPEKDKKSVPATDKSNTEDESSPDPKKKKDDSKQKKDKLPVDDKKKADETPDDKKEDQKKVPPTDEKGDDSKDDKTDDKTGADDKKEVAPDPYEKRYKDTQTWANRLSQENATLKAQADETSKKLDILQKQIADPDYDPNSDPKYAGPTSEEIASESVIAGKILASRHAAVAEHGEEKVNGILSAFKETFKDNAAVMLHIKGSDSPVKAAMDVMEDYAFRSKYGARPSEIHANLTKEIEATLRPKIRAELMAEIADGGKLKDATVGGLSGVRSGEKAIDDTKKGEVHTPLKKIFG